MFTPLKAMLRLALAALVLAPAAFAHDLRGYRITDIGVFGPPERPVLFARAINNRGHVTGDPQFLYRNGELESLAIPGVGARGNDLNDRGQIVGDSFASFTDPSQVFFWDRGAVHFIGTAGDLFLGDWHPLNNRGEVVGGNRFDATGSRAFLYREGTLHDLGTLPGGSNSFANAINNRGMIVGFSDTGANSFDIHPFLWFRGQMLDLTAAIGAELAVPTAINDVGDIAGSRHNLDVNPSQRRPFLLTRGRLIDIRLRPDHDLANAVALNIRREIVGWVSTRGGSLLGFYYHRGKLSLIDEIVLESDPLRPFVTFREAFDINDRGQILMHGTDSRSTGVRGYILTPRALPHQLIAELLWLARWTHLPKPYVEDLRRARVLLGASQEGGAAAALERFTERLRSSSPRRLPKWLVSEMLRDAEDCAGILRGWAKPPEATP